MNWQKNIYRIIKSPLVELSVGEEGSRETCQKKRISVGSHSVLPTDRQTADSTKRGFGICGFLSEAKLRSWKKSFFAHSLWRIFSQKNVSLKSHILDNNEAWYSWFWLAGAITPKTQKFCPQVYQRGWQDLDEYQDDDQNNQIDNWDGAHNICYNNDHNGD